MRSVGVRVAVLVCGTGYTGEDGVELLCTPEDAVELWDALARRGASPAGLAARDTLRIEACFHAMDIEGPIIAALDVVLARPHELDRIGLAPRFGEAF